MYIIIDAFPSISSDLKGPWTFPCGSKYVHVMSSELNPAGGSTYEKNNVMDLLQNQDGIIYCDQISFI